MFGLLAIYSFISSDGYNPETSLSSKGRYALTATYMYLMNLHSFNRSKRNSYVAINFVLNSHIKLFGVNACNAHIVEDIRKLIEQGFVLPNGKRCSVRFCQYRAYNLERHKILGLSESFSTTKYFSSFNYITNAERLNARSSQDLLPSRHISRDKGTFENDCRAVENDANSHNVKMKSIFSSIPFTSIEEIGVMPSCIMQDIFAGAGKEGGLNIAITFEIFLGKLF